MLEAEREEVIVIYPSPYNLHNLTLICGFYIVIYLNTRPDTNLIKLYICQ